MHGWIKIQWLPLLTKQHRLTSPTVCSLFHSYSLVSQITWTNFLNRKWVHCTQMASTFTRSQCNRVLWNVVEQEVHIMDVQLANLQQLYDVIMSQYGHKSEECFQQFWRQKGQRGTPNEVPYEYTKQQRIRGWYFWNFIKHQYFYWFFFITLIF